jgi:hypothetical protein
MERISPLSDFIFLKFMGEKGDEVQLLAFLNAVLERPDKEKLKSVEIVECVPDTYPRKPDDPLFPFSTNAYCTIKKLPLVVQPKLAFPRQISLRAAGQEALPKCIFEIPRRRDTEGGS